MGFPWLEGLVVLVTLRRFEWLAVFWVLMSPLVLMLALRLLLG
jgi:hypothetical protein